MKDMCAFTPDYYQLHSTTTLTQRTVITRHLALWTTTLEGRLTNPTDFIIVIVSIRIWLSVSEHFVRFRRSIPLPSRDGVVRFDCDFHSDVQESSATRVFQR